ncbi:MAG TPA: hypothetical protein VGX28_01540 [Frankiaceae bacterium]|nr:hypothetical protein [Frankiaceae bacterium]
MKKHLVLRTEHLVELTNDELELAGGGAFERYTGNPLCSLSIVDPCVSNICVGTNRCIDTIG